MPRKNPNPGQHGGPRPGGGRPKGSKNKATIEREMIAAAQIDAARQPGRELARDVLEKLMGIAMGAAGVHKPRTDKELKEAQDAENALAKAENREPKKVNPGNWDLFGAWFDRAVYCAKELATYQSPKIKSMDAPAPPPDPSRVGTGRRRFTLRVFEGGKLVDDTTDAA